MVGKGKSRIKNEKHRERNKQTKTQKTKKQRKYREARGDSGGRSSTKIICPVTIDCL